MLILLLVVAVEAPGLTTMCAMPYFRKIVVRNTNRTEKSGTVYDLNCSRTGPQYFFGGFINLFGVAKLTLFMY